MSAELAKHEGSEGVALYRRSTDAAAICRDIVLKTACQISGRKYVKVEGWQAIATAHGCILSARDVVKTAEGWTAIGEVRRISDGVVLAVAEGFVGIDEPVWAGGEGVDKYGKPKIYPRRAEYACRAMAQTRACSRVARSAFALVVVMMDAGLETTPAEEMQGIPGHDAEDATPSKPTAAQKPPQTPPNVGKPHSPPPLKNVTPAGFKTADSLDITITEVISGVQSKDKPTKDKKGTFTQWGYQSGADKANCMLTTIKDQIGNEMLIAQEDEYPRRITYEPNQYGGNIKSIERAEA
jgi:hypothetical protein